MTANTDFEVVFPEWYDQRGEWEAESKGWLQGVELHCSDGTIHSLFFYDPVRIAQDLECEAKLGRAYIAERGLIVIPEVTRSSVLNAISRLVNTGFFSTSTSSNSNDEPNGAPPVLDKRMHIPII